MSSSATTNDESTTITTEQSTKETAKPTITSTDTTKESPTTTSPPTKKTKKKKKKVTPLYQGTAVKYYDGFMKNKRFNKGLKLSTACSIFKTAWELPENNGLILPSRVIRHFKQVLPKKPKPSKDAKTTKKTTTTKPKPKTNLFPRNTTVATTAMITASMNATTTISTPKSEKSPEPIDQRSRTMVDLHIPQEILDSNKDSDDISIEQEYKQQQQRRTMIPTSTNKKQANTLIDTDNGNKTNSKLDKIEKMIDRSNFDEQSLDEESLKPKKHIKKAKSIGILGIEATFYDSSGDEQIQSLKDFKKEKNIKFTPKAQDKKDEEKGFENVEDEENKPHMANAKSTTLTITSQNGVVKVNGIKIISSDTPQTPDDFIDHADITMDDLKPDVEHQREMLPRAETDIKHMHHDLVSFKAEIMKTNGPQLTIINDEKSNTEPPKQEKDESKQTQQQAQSESTSNDTQQKPKTTTKKKKKKLQILYAEDATKLFKKFNDGKRLKNGITLTKACNIFSVAWELPEENGRILPSKVARHFKQVLPKKPKKPKAGKNKHIKAANSVNIKPSMVTKARTHRDNPTGPLSIANPEEAQEQKNNNNELQKPQTMRGHAAPQWLGLYSQSTHQLHPLPRASAARVQVSTNALTVGQMRQPKKSIITDLENLISSDPNRSNANDEEKNEIKRERAGSMTDLHAMLGNDDDHEDEDQHVENDIDALFKEVKKQKEMEQKKKAKEEDVANAIDAALGF